MKVALQQNIAQFLLIGDDSKIDQEAKKAELSLNHAGIRIIHASSSEQAARLAVQKVHADEAQVLMKGNVQTKILLQEVLNKEYGLRTGRILSHVGLFEIPNHHKLIMLTDCAMNLEPSIEEKAKITENAVFVARKIGIDIPKVAILAAVEVVNPKMAPTVDGALLTQMQRRGQIKDCIIDGPLAFDNAISKKSALEKGIQSEVAGDADILVVPNIETGNALYKSFIYFANAKVASIICGAKAPIALTSRTDTYESKLYSLVLSLLSAEI